MRAGGGTGGGDMGKKDLRNLLHETEEFLGLHGIRPENVLWVGKSDGTLSITWNDFAKIADKEYDSGFGGNNVNGSLVVVGDTWWLERGEYDGSEWWEFKTAPILKPTALPFNNVFVNGVDDVWSK
jgi:hypothetical protein